MICCYLICWSFRGVNGLPSLVGHYYGFGYPMPPSSSYLKRIALYYDKIEVPGFWFYESQYSWYFTKRALEDWLEDLATKYWRHLEKWIDAGIVDLVGVDSMRKQIDLITKAHELDWGDSKYHTIISDLASRTQMIYHVEFLARLDGRLLRAPLKRWMKANFGKVDAANAANIFMRHATIDSLIFALVEAWNSDKVPTTDSPVAEGLLQYKLQRAVKDPQDPARTLSKILELTVPHFDKLSMEQVLQIREDYDDAFDKFRKEIAKINQRVRRFSGDIEQQDREIRSVVENQIYPQLAEIRKIQLDFQPKIKPEKMLLKALIGRIPYIDLLIQPLEALNLYRKQRELNKNSFYLLSLL